jgi:hypothetical protein
MANDKFDAAAGVMGAIPESTAASALRPIV